MSMQPKTENKVPRKYRNGRKLRGIGTWKELFHMWLHKPYGKR